MATRTFISTARSAVKRTSTAWELPQGTRTIDIIVSGPDWTIGSGNSVATVLEQSRDGGATWQHWISAILAPTLDKDGVTLLPASIGWELADEDRAARSVRVTATPGKSCRFGVAGVYV